MIPWLKSVMGAGQAAPRKANRVLVIQFGGLARFVAALTAAKAIRDYHVGARITLLTTEPLKPLAEKCPHFDTVEADGKPSDPQAITSLMARIRASKYDMVYDLEGSSRTANYFLALRPWPPNWSGPLADCSHPCVDPERDFSNPIDVYARQLQAAGFSLGDEFVPDLRWVRAALRDPPRLQPDYFGIRGAYVLMLPRGEAAGGHEKRWAEAKYIEIARRLVANAVVPVVLGGPDERPIGAAIAKAEPKAKNLVARPDLFQIIGMAERAAFVFGDDVELMHVAAAAGARCLVFISSNGLPDRDTPRGPAGVVRFTASVVADLPVEQVERQLRNSGVLLRASA